MLLHAICGDMTARLQDAIDRSSAQGRRLTLGPGIYETRGLVLRSGADLHLAKDAILKPAGDYDAYAGNRVAVVAEDSDRAILVAKDAENIRISGPGVIEAPGSAFVAGDLPEMGTLLPARLRPRVLVFDTCRRVSLEGVTIRQSPMWTVHLVGCADVEIAGITIDNDRCMPNTDGIVVDSCIDVDIRGATIATADDGIVLKTTRRTDGTPVGPCRAVTVRNCRVESRSCALKIGTESHSDFGDIAFADCSVVSSNRALGIFSRDGGRIGNVAFRRIAVECAETPDGFWGSGEAITVNVIDRRPERPAGAVHNILFEDINGVMEGAINLVAERPASLNDVVLRRVALRQRLGSLGTGARYDLRPTRADLAPAAGTTGRANAYVQDDAGRVIGLFPYPGGMPALYSLQVQGLVLDRVAFERPAPLPAGWNRQERMIA